MNFFFTLLFITTAYITPPVLFGPLAPYHIEIVIAFLAVISSFPSLNNSGLLRWPQTYATIGLCLAVIASFVGNGYFGGAPPALYGFLISAAAFFLTAVNCRSRAHLRWIVLSMFLCSLFYIAHGASDVYHHVNPSQYVFGAEVLPRIRGLGVVNDPNDFAQVMVSLIPCVFLWKSRSHLLNIFLVWFPIALLITGMYLTHSRGSAIALMVVCALAARKKIGTVPAIVLAGLLLIAALGAGWSGGRDVSMEAGSDRLDAWSAGLEMIKSHPFVGVGAGRFWDFYGITAHNTVIVCAAEIGLSGLICWVFFIFSTYRLGFAFFKTGEPDEKSAELTDVIPSTSELWRPDIQKNVGTRQTSPPVQSAHSFWMSPPMEVRKIDHDELRRIASILMISLTGFLAAGWFLSRAYSMWLFLYVGMVCATARMANENGLKIRRDAPGYLMRWSIFIAAGLLLFVYVLLRYRTLTER
ncbi:MAG: O-antigen ligase family protein [Acidobacteria bacterium]|nr:O-antigen ligase family protein [Acidobacteriota bacterium]